MINSRSLKDLHLIVAEKASIFLLQCEREGIDLLVTSTYRDIESQNALYKQGREFPGKIVTNAKGGFSYHNWRVAFDVVPIQNGKPVWNTDGKNLLLWRKIGEIGKQIGLEWAGDWIKFREFPHFQYTNNFKLVDFQNGAKP